MRECTYVCIYVRSYKSMYLWTCVYVHVYVSAHVYICVRRSAVSKFGAAG